MMKIYEEIIGENEFFSLKLIISFIIYWIMMMIGRFFINLPLKFKK